MSKYDFPPMISSNVQRIVDVFIKDDLKPFTEDFTEVEGERNRKAIHVWANDERHKGFFFKVVYDEEMKKNSNSTDRPYEVEYFPTMSGDIFKRPSKGEDIKNLYDSWRNVIKVYDNVNWDEGQENPKIAEYRNLLLNELKIEELSEDKKIDYAQQAVILDAIINSINDIEERLDAIEEDIGHNEKEKISSAIDDFSELITNKSEKVLGHEFANMVAKVAVISKPYAIEIINNFKPTLIGTIYSELLNLSASNSFTKLLGEG